MHDGPCNTWTGAGKGALIVRHGLFLDDNVSIDSCHLPPREHVSSLHPFNYTCPHLKES